MIRRLILLAIMVTLTFALSGCFGGLANGNLIGTVVRESDGSTVPFPVLIIGRKHSSPLVPDQMITGDAEGRFEITTGGGNYTFQIGTNESGPFYTWPDDIYVQENHTTVMLFELPEGY